MLCKTRKSRAQNHESQVKWKVWKLFLLLINNAVNGNFQITGKVWTFMWETKCQTEQTLNELSTRKFWSKKSKSNSHTTSTYFKPLQWNQQRCFRKHNIKYQLKFWRFSAHIGIDRRSRTSQRWSGNRCIRRQLAISYPLPNQWQSPLLRHFEQNPNSESRQNTFARHDFWEHSNAEANPTY